MFQPKSILCFPGMLLRYCLKDYEIVPVSPAIVVITFVFTFHVHLISIIRSLHFRIFSASFLIMFLSPEIVTSIYIHVPFSLSRTMISSLLLGMVLSVYTCWFYNMLTLLSQLVLTVFDTWSYQCSLSNFTPILLHMLKCSWTHTESCLLMYCSSANIGHADIKPETNNKKTFNQ